MISVRSRAATASAVLVAALVAALAAPVTIGAAAPSAQADPAPAPGAPATVSAYPLPTAQLNGIGWAQVVDGRWVYVTGDFTAARPAGAAPGTQQTAVGGILRYDITTGVLDASFIHNLNAAGEAITTSPDGTTVYVGGKFSTVDGVPHNRIVAFDNATGAIDTAFTASVGGEVLSLAASATEVYAGGNFANAAGNPSLVASPRSDLAAFDPVTGALSTAWAPKASAGGSVKAMVLALNGTRVIAGGHFATLNGVAAPGMGSLDATTGKTEQWQANSTIHASGSGGAIDTLATDGTDVYGGGYSFGTGQFEGRFAANPATGAIEWLDDCHGDTYSVFPAGAVLYSVGHAHDCSAIGAFPDAKTRPAVPGVGEWNRALAESTQPSGGTNVGPDSDGWNFSGVADSSVLNWLPHLTAAPKSAASTDPAPLPGTVAFSGAAQAGWSITGNADYISVAGEMTAANGVLQQGIVRYAIRALTTNPAGPTGPVATSVVAPTVTPGNAPGTAMLAWTAAWDRDNQLLTYAVYRDGAARAIYSTTVASTFWSLPRINALDSGLVAGSHSYRLTVTDADGRSVSASARVLITAGAPAGAPRPSPDLALGKATAESTVYQSSANDPGKAVDGNTDGAYADASMATTSTGASSWWPAANPKPVANPAAGSWWQVDLDARQPVRRIVVYGRSDCCADQSSDLWVLASTTPFDTRLPLAELARQQGVFARHLTGPALPSATVTLPPGTLERYLLIGHGGTDYLTLAEVQAYSTS